MQGIYHCFWINAPLTKVYSALAEIDGLKGWWTGSVDGPGTVGSITTFRFSSGAFNRMQIKAIEPVRVEWECVDGNEEWIDTRVHFNFRQDDKRVKVCFTHDGWKEITEYTGECSFHWAYYFMSLQRYCETGTGTPNDG